MAEETEKEAQTKEESEIANLPFPHARIKDILKNKLKAGCYIKKKAAIDLNLWLGRLADKIAEDVAKTENAYTTES